MTKSQHEGVLSMNRDLKSEKFAKVRIGVGSPSDEELMKNYLLKDFTDDEKLLLIRCFEQS
jgi:PTH1 family peptidyl-tRNA hydrolase